MRNKPYIADITHTIDADAVAATGFVAWIARTDLRGHYWQGMVAGLPDVWVARQTNGDTIDYMGWFDGDAEGTIFPTGADALAGMTKIALQRHRALPAAK